MKIKVPSNTSAALAGAWAMLGTFLLPWGSKGLPLSYDAFLFFVWAIFFIWLPSYYFVSGRVPRSDAESTFFERIRSHASPRPAGISKRHLYWLGGALGTMFFLALAIGILISIVKH